MKIMCDTNIIIDVLLEREPFTEDSCKVLSLCEEHKIDGFISASSITDIYYLVRKYTHSTDLAYKAVGKLLEIVKVCSVTNSDVLTAFQQKAKELGDSRGYCVFSWYYFMFCDDALWYHRWCRYQ